MTFTYPSHTTKGCVPLSSDVKVKANKVRIVTVFAPNKEGDVKTKHLSGVKASTDLADTAITLEFDDGSVWTLDEKKLSGLA